MRRAGGRQQWAPLATNFDRLSVTWLESTSGHCFLVVGLVSSGSMTSRDTAFRTSSSEPLKSPNKTWQSMQCIHLILAVATVW